MSLVFMGTPDYALPVLEALVSTGQAVAGVYTQPDRPAGRGRLLTPPPVKTCAQKHGLPVFQPASLRRAEAIEELAALAPELIVVAAYGKILPPAVLAIPTRGVLNIHPSLLPRHRGPSPVVTALLEGEAVTGVTVMRLDEGMDTGDIVAQREAAVRPGETAGDLTLRLFSLGAELLLEVLPEWMKGEITPRPQEAERATITRRYTKEDGEIDWALPALSLERRLRAFTPWPGCYTRWQGKLLKVLEGVRVEAPAASEGGPGRVVAAGQGSPSPVGVVTGQGLLGLLRVQLEGSRPLSAEEFVRGYPGFLSARLPS